ncbi:hypothetical protein DdX_11614 [Ditylenchus destructor]|uniref:ShKT domain-containing protein n=1 Tax=Ditylenchus destructor TaxID=166010 RepID=A0AAD4R4E4_9BILA|nr:hypothetical protein DdX_11614 [Ditylenchus destructor]
MLRMHAFGITFVIMVYVIPHRFSSEATTLSKHVTGRGKIVVELNPSAAVHKFIYNNEQLCGDMFGQPGWLPAHRKCQIQCQTGVEICQMADPAASGSTAAQQRCLLLPVECRAKLKEILAEAGFASEKQNLAIKLNEEDGPPSIRPPKSPGNSRSTAGDDRPSPMSPSHGPTSWIEQTGPIGPPGPISIMPPAIEAPRPPSTTTATSSNDKVDSWVLEHTPGIADRGTGTRISPPSKKPSGGGESLLPLSTDDVFLPLPEIVLSSSTFPPLPPPSFTSFLKTPSSQLPKRISTTTTTRSPPTSGGGWSAGRADANRPTTTTTAPMKTTTEKVDDSLQINYENMLIEKMKNVGPRPTLGPPRSLQRTTTTLPDSATLSFRATTKLSSFITVPITTTVATSTMTTTLPNMQPLDYDGGESTNNIFGINSNPFQVDESTRGANSKPDSKHSVAVIGGSSTDDRTPMKVNQNQVAKTSNPYDPNNAISSEWVSPSGGYESAAVLSPPNEVQYNYNGPTQPTERPDEDDVHIFGPPIGSPSGVSKGMPSNPWTNNFPTAKIDQSTSSSWDSELPGVQKQEKPSESPAKVLAVQRSANTVEQVDLSTELDQKSRAVQEPWWSWRQLADKLKRKPFYVQENGLVLDRSIRCCQWALDGLCDRSWQRIRQLCPKSCGTVVCSAAEGALACNRVIDVDVIDCYEQRRRIKAFGIATAKHNNGTNRGENSKDFSVFDSQNVEARRKNSELTDGLEEKFSSRTPAFASLVDENTFLKAFAVEDEIKRFNQLNSHRIFSMKNSTQL